MEALIRPHEFRALNTVMGIEGSFLLRIGDVGIEPNRLQAPGIDGKSVKGPLIEADVWTHLAVTYDADAKTCIVYVNGEEFVRNENTQAGIEGDGGTVHIGAPFADTQNKVHIVSELVTLIMTTDTYVVKLVNAVYGIKY